MKKIFVCLFIFVACSSYAQMPKFLVGVNAAGVWNSYALTKNTINYFASQSRMNFKTGFQGKYFLTNKIALNCEIDLETKNLGSAMNLNAIEYGAGIYKYTVKQTFIEIPISFSYLLKTIKATNIFCSVGLTNSFRLQAKHSGDESPAFEKYKPNLLSLKLGSGVIFPIGKDFYATSELYRDIYV